MNLEKVLRLMKNWGEKSGHPHSEVFREGNETCQSLNICGISDLDQEVFYHKPVSTFPCHIPGCDRFFDTVFEYESHYTTCHSFTCIECNKNLPNNHLLDLHILETHDFFFSVQAQKVPMYKCFLEECKVVFKNSSDRKDHCIKTHEFPGDFRFDTSKKRCNLKKSKNICKPIVKTSKLKPPTEGVETSSSENAMDVSENIGTKSNKDHNQFNGFHFGRNKCKRKAVLLNFSKDLMDSLPDS